MGWKPFVEGLETMVLNHGFKPFSREEVHCKPSLEGFETGFSFRGYLILL